MWFKGSPYAPKPRRRSARPSLRCQRVSYPQAVSSAPVEVGTVPEKADKGFWRRKRAQVPKSTDEVQHDAEARQLQVRSRSRVSFGCGMDGVDAWPVRGMPASKPLRADGCPRIHLVFYW